MAAHTRSRLDLVFLTFCFCISVWTCSGQNCLLPGHDMANLTNNVWQFRGNTSAECLSYNNTATTCLFNMRFCKALSQSLVCGTNASVCQFDNAATFKEFRMAGFKDMPFEEFENGKQGFRTTFPLGGKFTYEGENKTAKVCDLNTTIYFKCNTAKYWPTGSGGQPQNVPVQPEIKFIKEKCLYNITFEFAGACVMILPSTPTNHSLSAGSVLVIIFFVFMLSYFVFGSMWNIGCRGARGKEVIPNLDFWIMLPVYIADGFLFTFRCGQIESSTYESI